MARAGDPAAGRAYRTEKELKAQEGESWLRFHLPEWLDGIIRRMFLALEHGLEAIEMAAKKPSKPGDEKKSPAQQDTGQAGMEAAIQSEKNARTLASLERTLERLMQLEKQRASVRAQQEENEEDVKAALERLVAEAMARSGPSLVYGEAD